jgi:phosphoribosylaminoimidazole-succinocarboxamide synthase
MEDYIRTLEGSVKTIKVLQEPTLEAPGMADFYVKDDYSVFDWGRMPLADGAFVDNRALLWESAFNFELLESEDVPVGYRGLVMPDGKVMSVDDAAASGIQPVAMRMQLVNLIPLPFDEEKGMYDYSGYQRPMENNYMSPIEWIFRVPGRLPDGASITKRIEKNKASLSELGLPPDYKAGDPLPCWVKDISTKYEKEDRYDIPLADMQMMAGLTADEFEQCGKLLMYAARRVVEHAASVGIHVFDGKGEIAVVDRQNSRFSLVDFFGTKDENRRTVLPIGKMEKDVPTSKQAKRKAHKLRDREWYDACDEEKKLAEQEGRDDWKERVLARGLEPQALPLYFVDADNDLSNAVVNAVCSKDVIPASSLEDAALAFVEAEKRLKSDARQGL